MNKKTVCFTYLTASIIAELIDVSYLSFLTEKHSEDSVRRCHHQQRRLSGEFEEINVFLPSCFLLVCPSNSREPDMSRIRRGNVFKLETNVHDDSRMNGFRVWFPKFAVTSHNRILGLNS